MYVGAYKAFWKWVHQRVQSANYTTMMYSERKQNDIL